MYFLCALTIAIADGIPPPFGIIWTVISLLPFMLGVCMWGCLVHNLHDKANSTSNPEVEDKCAVRIKRSIASVLIGFGFLFTVLGLVSIHRPNSSEVDTTNADYVTSGKLWPIIIWMVVSIIRIVVGCSVCYCIEKGRREGYSDRSDSTLSTIVPQVKTIEIQVAQEPHTSFTTPPPPEYSSIFFITPQK